MSYFNKVTFPHAMNLKKENPSFFKRLKKEKLQLIEYYLTATRKFKEACEGYEKQLNEYQGALNHKELVNKTLLSSLQRAESNFAAVAIDNKRLLKINTKLTDEVDYAQQYISKLKEENNELYQTNKVLVEENRKLKEVIRRQASGVKKEINVVLDLSALDNFLDLIRGIELDGKEKTNTRG